MAKTEYRSAIRSRKLINQALADLLQEKPLDKITVTDVVRRAEINRGTFYAHYTDIPDVINHLIQQTFSHLREAISDSSQPIEKLPGVMLSRLQDILETDLDLYRKIMNSSASSLMQEQLVDIVLEYLFQNEDKFSFGDHAQYVLHIRFCAGGLGNLYRDWFAGKLPLTLDELTKQAESLLNRVMSDVIPKNT